jgi:hypothetical protein
VLIDIFVRIEGFFMRLESYTEVRPTAVMTYVIVKIMTEVLSILAIATKEIKQGRSSESIDISELLFANLFQKHSSRSFSERRILKTRSRR